MHALAEDLPVGQVGHAFEAQQLPHHRVEVLVVQHEREVVDVVGVGGVHHRVNGDVAEIRDLPLQVVGDRRVAAAHDDVGLDAPAAQLGHRVLGGLGLVLAGGADERHQRDVYVTHVAAPHVQTDLADGLQERQDLDVANGAADLHDDHVHVRASRAEDATLDLVGDVRDDLHGGAEVVAAPFGVDHRRIDRPGGGVGFLREVLVDEPLVVAEVEVGLAAVGGDEHLAVLEGIHGARIHVEVGIQLLHGHPQTTGFEERTERGRRQALAQRTRHTARHEDVLRHGMPGYLKGRLMSGTAPRTLPRGEAPAGSTTTTTRGPGAGVEVRMGRANWSSGYLQNAICPTAASSATT